MPLPKIVRQYLDAYNRKDVPGMLNCLDPHIAFENSSKGGQRVEILGIEKFAELAAQSAKLFEKRHQHVVTAVVEGDSVALEVDWTGTPSIDIGGVKQGQQVSMRGASFITLKGQKIIRIADIS
jgi:ketosteroid isomerase-like protein